MLVQRNTRPFRGPQTTLFGPQHRLPEQVDTGDVRRDVASGGTASRKSNSGHALPPQKSKKAFPSDFATQSVQRLPPECTLSHAVPSANTSQLKGTLVIYPVSYGWKTATSIDHHQV
ncbi:Hypothetical predicted protein [Cloeon dipterum]|uniref:Uncharacterized protein n=1 Tax=Cloeon dipterum TaxID=197152 RepID=A0A8S1CMC4_9INSE|nr:Hypothetical predicted protein [Cloeon dipterum]